MCAHSSCRRSHIQLDITCYDGWSCFMMCVQSSCRRTHIQLDTTRYVINSGRVPRALVGDAVCNWTLPTMLMVHCGGRCCPWGWFWRSECCSHCEHIKDDLTWRASCTSNFERCATASFPCMRWCLDNKRCLAFSLAFFFCNFLCIARNGDSGSILLIWNNSHI